MKVPFSWLKQYVDIDVTAQELEDKLFGCGFEVEELIDLGGEISKVVVGVVTECVPQEGTHLHICKVDCGEYGHDIQYFHRRTQRLRRYAHRRRTRRLHARPADVKIKANAPDGRRVQRYAVQAVRNVGLNDDLVPRCRGLRPARIAEGHCPRHAPFSRSSALTTTFLIFPSRPTAPTARVCSALRARLQQC